MQRKFDVGKGTGKLNSGHLLTAPDAKKETRRSLVIFNIDVSSAELMSKVKDTLQILHSIIGHRPFAFPQPTPRPTSTSPNS